MVFGFRALHTKQTVNATERDYENEQYPVSHVQ
jgi:hypothetical protein